MLRIALLLCLLSASLAASSADIFETGGDLYKLCKQASDPAKRDPFSFGLCMGYIDGYISGYRFKKEVQDSPNICPDIETRSRREVLKQVVDYLAQHPESQKQLKSIAMYQAMRDKMTCPTRNDTK